MTLQRIDEVSGPPEIERYYLVPTVEAEWSGRTAIWPVIGPRHNDRHCLDFKWDHYHLDARFMPSFGNGDDARFFWRRAASAPVMTSHRINADGLPSPVWRRRRCRRLHNPQSDYLRGAIAESKEFGCLHAEFAGRQSRHDGSGWVCPHRKVPLAGHAPVDGVITCPLHFLRIDAVTGVVLPAKGEAES